jgi:glutathione S-transferase
MKFFYNPGSSNSRRAEAVIRHLGLEGVEMVLLNHMAGEHRTPEFQAINPNFKLPALQDGDFTLWESNAIMQYLADGSPLFPADPQVRADISRWQFWTSFNFGPTTAALLFENTFKEALGMGTPDPAVVAAETQKLETFSKLLDQHLEGREYLVGDSLTLADFAVCAEMSFNAIGNLDFSAYPNLTAWEKRLDALPAWQQTVIQLQG